MIQIIEVIKNTDVEMLVRLLIAAVLGLAMGIERELKRKSLGLKTILVISVVSCLLTIVSIQSAYIFPSTTFAEIRMDPLRLAAQIVSGVGFLGAGVILRRGDDTVSGLTTAAIVWGAAGIGIATGAGFYVAAVIGVVLLLISVELIPAVINRIGVEKFHLKEIYVRLTLTDQKAMCGLIQRFKQNFSEMEIIRIKDLSDEAYLVVLLIMVDDQQTPQEIYQVISKVDHIKGVEIRT